MARATRTEYDESQAAKRLRVPVAAFRWARSTGLVPPPTGSSSVWPRAVVEAMDAEAIKASLPRWPISGAAAANRIAEALGTPNQPQGKASVTAFVVRQFIRRGLLTELSANPDGSLVNPDQVDAVCQREDLAVLVAEDTPLGPEQAASRLKVRRVEFNYMLALGWIQPADTVDVRFGTSRAGAVPVALFRTADVDALERAHPEIDWERLRSMKPGQRSPLATLTKAAARN
ncbi:hypothetical protein ACFYZ8_34275 [Streptomyces sp. NPDC001668]|uniref:hypothetical protein n=1 Tax=Streptomyces sp. NPDC001668 TaxID=3364598 RepID=UPI00369BD173